ncbi:MAG: phospho-N-acetylmuramoyl-pentapeptide-transferase, partial [Alphaproteobacteria bacterium]|nr:phospho-N-acetylmuramoyl-pentapeptide-transferase [Alphaproteobacteria bacterium]
MLYNLLSPLTEDFQIFNLFRYITFRTGGAIMTALIISFIFGPKVINWLRVKQHGASNVREDTPEGHLKKAGTPSMGGFLILLALSISTLLWADLRNGYVWIVLLVTMGFGGIGFADDYLKLTKKNS